MYILGLTESGHNSAACLLENGKLLTFIEEERFTRVKTSPNAYPIKASIYCLNKNGIKLSDITYIAIGWNIEKYRDFMPNFYKGLNQKYNKDKNTNLSEKMLLERFDVEKVKLKLKNEFLKNGCIDKMPPIIFVGHHLAHAASSFYCSGFNKSIVLTIDGSGENLTTSAWLGNELNIDIIEKYEIPQSLGWFYSAMTEYLGFSSNQQEGTVMGLAPYGKDDYNIRKVLGKVLSFTNDHYEIDPDYLFYGEHNYGIRFTDKLVNELGRPRKKNGEMTQFYKNIAYITQNILESTVKQLVIQYTSRYSLKNLCLSGGVAMNCKLNGEISQMEEVEELFIQPASDDSGTCLGAAMIVSKAEGYDPRFEMKHAYWGCEFSDEEVEEALKIAKVKYRKIDNCCEVAAEYLANGKVIGWFNGKSEIGARALGARSIIANPSIKNMKDILNNEIKFREPWRPFAPSINIEQYDEVFGKNMKSPFMLLGIPVDANGNENISSTIHIDGTSRPQAVDKKYNPRYWSLINNFYKLTGVPAVLNTSFNIKGEPIVRTPQDALRCFFSTGLDALFIENFMVGK